MTSETPGLVCAHHHLAATLARGMPVPARTPTSFVEVLERIWWRFDRALDLELVRASARLGALEALEAGTTGIVDLHSSPNAIEGSLDVIAEACAEVGVRVRCSYEVTDRNGIDEANAGLVENERFLRAGGDGFVGAHACFTLSDDTLDAVSDLAADLGVGVHLHVAEAEADVGAGSRLLVRSFRILEVQLGPVRRLEDAVIEGLANEAAQLLGGDGEGSRGERLSQLRHFHAVRIRESERLAALLEASAGGLRK